MNTQAATDSFIKWVGKDAKGKNYARKLDSIDDELADDEYLVIVDSGKDKRVSSQYFGFDDVISDYHFVVRNPGTGKYSHKPGEDIIKPMDTSEVLKDWDLGVPEEYKEFVEGWKGFYNDGKRYVAVKLEVREFGFKEFY